MNSLKDKLHGDLTTTRTVGGRGQETALEPAVIEAVMDTIQGETLQRLNVLENPICIGPTVNNQILFVDGSKELDELLELERMSSSPHEDHGAIRTQIHAEGLRLLTPQEARMIERATSSHFIGTHGTVSSNLESEDGKQVFWTHPIHSFHTGHFIIGNKSGGDHITTEQNCRTTWSRRGFSVALDSIDWGTRGIDPSVNSKEIQAVLEEYDRRFLKNPIIKKTNGDGETIEWHMDWPSMECLGASLRRAPDAINSMPHAFIQSIEFGEILVLNPNKILNVHGAELPPENRRWARSDCVTCNHLGSPFESSSSTLDLIFPGEWRLSKT